MNVGAERLVVARDGGDDLARFRRRRGAVEIDERRAVVAALEQRKPVGAHQRLTSRYLPEASGAMARDALAANRALRAARRRPQRRALRRCRRRSGSTTSRVSPASCHCSSVDSRAERRMDRVVEQQRRDVSPRDVRAVALPAFDALEQRPVALEPARRSRATRPRARRRRCRSAAAASRRGRASSRALAPSRPPPGSGTRSTWLCRSFGCSRPCSHSMNSTPASVAP